MATNSEKLDEILEIVHQIKIDNATRDAEVKSIQKCLNDVYKSVKGNGKDGLELDMANVKNKFRIVTWVATLIFGAVVLDVTSRIIALLK